MAPFVIPALKTVVVNAIVKNIGQKKEADEIAMEVMKDVVANPVVKNQLNMEAPYQSRVAVGSAVSALGVLLPFVLQIFGVDIAQERVLEIVNAIVVLWGAGYALYGRFWPGLKPLFSK